MIGNKKHNKIIEDSIEQFLDRIRKTIEIKQYKRTFKARYSFEIFKPGNDEYYEYKFFERRLEWYIRDLVNSILSYLLQENSIKCMFPDEDSRLRIDYSNSDFEEVNPFEFVIKNKYETVGYRYTFLASNEIDYLIKQYSINRIVILNWENTEDKYSLKEMIGCPDKRVTQQSLRSFFDEYLNDDLFNVFVTKIRTAVGIANEEIGFQTIPKMSLRYLSGFKAELNETLSSLDFSKMKYQILNHLDKNNFNRVNEFNLDSSDFNEIKNNFVEKELYKALLGSEDFAKCFITSEYLYTLLESNNFFDYTAVVCGYFKSVEQLLYKVMQIELETNPSEDLWIKSKGNPQGEDTNINFRRNPKIKKTVWQVRFNKENEKYFSIELGSLIWFYNDNDICSISEGGRQSIRKLLLQYNQECRNDHFHKDNIYSFQEVERVRNNTLLILFYIIGSCRLFGEVSKNKLALGIQDDSFDRFYKALLKIPTHVPLCIKFPGEEEKYLRRMGNQKSTIYNTMGSVKGNVLKFISIEKYEEFLKNDFLGFDEVQADVLIDENNVPEKAWYIKYSGEMVEIKW
jgi:hypothetical protein